MRRNMLKVFGVILGHIQVFQPLIFTFHSLGEILADMQYLGINVEGHVELFSIWPKVPV